MELVAQEGVGVMGGERLVLMKALEGEELVLVGGEVSWMVQELVAGEGGGVVAGAEVVAGEVQLEAYSEVGVAE